MTRRLPIFYNALLLTGVNLMLQLVSTGFQIYLSGVIGAAGIGLLQLVLSVGRMALTAGIAGIRTSAMYLCAGELGRPGPKNMERLLTGCAVYSLVCSFSVSAALQHFAPWLAENWIGSGQALGALRLLGLFLPVSCLCGVMTGYYTAANRVSLLAVIEIFEQLFSMTVTATALYLSPRGAADLACQAVVLGTGCGNLLTLVLLILLIQLPAKTGKTQPVTGRILKTALPLAVADDLKSGISTAENLMVPKRLALYTSQALASFGILTGMVFPVLMFPATVLYALAELLIPELARCSATDLQYRIRYLVRKSLGIGLTYGLLWGGVLFLIAPELGTILYRRQEVGIWLRYYALLAPMLYSDAIVDAMNKGLGQQVHSVRYNILTSAMDIVFLYLLLPNYGMRGYFLSFLITHVVNFALSLYRLLRASRAKIRWQQSALRCLCAIAAVLLCCQFSSVVIRCAGFIGSFFSLLYLTGALGKHHWRWLLDLIFIKKKAVP